MKKDITIYCKSVNVEYGGSEIRCEITDVDIDDVISELGQSDVVENIGVTNILANLDKDFFLDEIGVDTVKTYFGLTEIE